MGSGEACCGGALGRRGGPPEGGARAVRLDLIVQLLRRAADPDWAFFDQLKDGLPLGVAAVMDRTPRVFEEKVRWKLGKVDGPGARECGNYLSLDGHIEEVEEGEELFKEEEKLGWMVEMAEEESQDILRRQAFHRLLGGGPGTSENQSRP